MNSAPTVTLLVGHVLDKLKDIPDGSAIRGNLAQPAIETFILRPKL
jgi:hypothetical protein